MEKSIKSKIYVYLAGPDVFLPNAAEVFEGKKRICREYGLEPLSPGDTDFNDKFNTLPTKEVAREIYQFDIAMMNQADACLANMEPFRGPSMDTGTAFEMGYMTAQGKPIVGYSNDLREYSKKVSALGITDTKFTMVEGFGLIDNLMMVESVRSQGIEILANFEDAVKALVKLLGT